MRHQPENNDWMGPSAPYSDSDRRKTTDQESTDPEKDTTKRHAAAAPAADPEQAPTGAGPGRGRKRKLEDLNDRDDLSERQLSNRNWL
jgi:hypothetical protein